MRVTVTLITANTSFKALATDTERTLAEINVRALGLNYTVIAITDIVQFMRFAEIAIMTNITFKAWATARE